jgi:hypothetical protein
MSLTKVFDALADAILIINQVGKVNYFNQPASELIKGTHVDTIGIGQLGNMLSLVLNEQILTPYSFNIQTSSNAKYLVTVSKLYSLYIVAMCIQPSEIDNDQFQFDKNPKNFNSISNQLHDLFNDEIDLFSTFFISKIPDSDYQLLNEAHNLKKKLNLMMNAIFLSGPKKPELLVEVLGSVDCQTELPLLSKNVELNVYGVSKIDSLLISCHPEWFKIILSDCLNHLIFNEDSTFNIVVTVDQSCHYISLHITARNSSIAHLHQNFTMRKIFKGLTQNTHKQTNDRKSHNIPLARYLIKRLHGYIAVLNQDLSPGIIIKLPTYPPTQDEKDMMHEQSRVFAHEIGQLKLKMEKETNQ